MTVYILQTKVKGFSFYINQGYETKHNEPEMTTDPEESLFFDTPKKAYNFLRTYRLRGFDVVQHNTEIQKPVRQKKIYSQPSPAKKIQKIQAFSL